MNQQYILALARLSFFMLIGVVVYHCNNSQVAKVCKQTATYNQSLSAILWLGNSELNIYELSSNQHQELTQVVHQTTWKRYQFQNT